VRRESLRARSGEEPLSWIRTVSPPPCINAEARRPFGLRASTRMTTSRQAIVVTGRNTVVGLARPEDFKGQVSCPRHACNPFDTRLKETPDPERRITGDLLGAIQVQGLVSTSCSFVVDHECSPLAGRIPFLTLGAFTALRARTRSICVRIVSLFVVLPVNAPRRAS
jgi:hypothetical protein